MFGLFTPPIPFRFHFGQPRRPYIELPGVAEGRERKALQAFKGMGRLRIRSKSNDFGHLVVRFNAGFEPYSLHVTAGTAFIRGESGGDEITMMLVYMRKSRRFRELVDDK